MAKDPKTFAYGTYWKRDENGELVPDEDDTDTVQATAERTDRDF